MTQFRFDDGHVVCHLHVHPQRRARTKVAAETNGSFARDRPPPLEGRRNPICGNSECEDELASGFAGPTLGQVSLAALPRRS